MLHWRLIDSASPKPVLQPGSTYDKEGIFTGCFWPTGPSGEKDQLTIFYTSVCKLPMHWTLPYTRGMEGLAAAVSKDAGKSWTKLAENPILKEEPGEINVFGWRDPYLAPWPALDELRGEQSLYGIISGGVREGGPTTFLYAVDPKNLTSWTYICPLLDLPKNFKPSEKWSADLGWNLECTNFMTLSTPEDAKQFLILGAEGGKERPWVEKTANGKLPVRTVRWAQWFCGNLQKDHIEEQIHMEYGFGGVLDHGVLYAANTLVDPKTDTRVMWAWIPEEDVTIDMCRLKGWNGCLGLPRELFLKVIPDVVKALSTPLNDIATMEMGPAGSQKFTLRTLGIRPLKGLSVLRQSELLRLTDVRVPAKDQPKQTTDIQSAHFEISATVRLTPGSSNVGFILRHNQDGSIGTKVEFDMAQENIVVNRSSSTNDLSINTCPDLGPFTLFTQSKVGEEETQESLKLRIFGDGDVLEVFANDRFSLSTMIYPPQDALGISLFAEGDPESVVFDSLEIWDMSSIHEGGSTV